MEGRKEERKKRGKEGRRKLVLTRHILDLKLREPISICPNPGRPIPK